MTTTKKTEAEILALFEDAHETGMAAGRDACPTPMVVQGWEHAPIMDGVCGFAWVTIKPAGSREGRVAKAHGWTNAYGGGVMLWVCEFNQSLTRKEAYAHAYASVLREAGINATADSRID